MLVDVQVLGVVVGVAMFVYLRTKYRKVENTSAGVYIVLSAYWVYVVVSSAANSELFWCVVGMIFLLSNLVYLEGCSRKLEERKKDGE